MTRKTSDQKGETRHARDDAAATGLSPVNGKAVAGRLIGGALSSEAGLLALRRSSGGSTLPAGWRPASTIPAPRPVPSHSVADPLRLQMMMIAAGHEDGIDANALRADPIFKMALERAPEARDLCSQSTVSRLETLSDRRMAHTRSRGERWGHVSEPWYHAWAARWSGSRVRGHSH